MLIRRNSQKTVINTQSFATAGVPKGRPLRLGVFAVLKEQWRLQWQKAVGSRQKAEGSRQEAKVSGRFDSLMFNVSSFKRTVTMAVAECNVTIEQCNNLTTSIFMNEVSNRTIKQKYIAWPVFLIPEFCIPDSDF